jgi:flagellar hook-basal body complex protein FliE
MSVVNSAIGAYNAASQAGGLGKGTGGILNQSAEVKGASFGDILKTATQGVIDSQKAGEKASAEAVIGKADLTDVVNAVNNAEMSLSMFLAIRDKMLDAYNQITRTQI